MMKLSRRLSVVALAAAASTVLASGVAYAFWSTSGSGSGAASVGGMTAPTVSVGTVTPGQLYPGATAADLVVAASNPNPFPITVTLTQAAGTVTGCTTPAVTFAGGSFTLTANQSTTTKTLVGTVSMGTTASNDCQNQTLTIPLTSSSQSS